MNTKRLILSCGLAIAVMAQAANAAVYSESGDAGDTLAGAQALPAGTTQVQGTIAFIDDVDMFAFTWAGGFFTANTVGGSHNDPMLWLFDSAGRGIQADDDAIIANGHLDALLEVQNLAAGTYYLAISAFYVEPFSDAAGTVPMFPYPQLSGPLDPNAQLASWGGQGYAADDYVINIGLTEVPEPGTIALLGAGLFGLGLMRRQRRS